MKIFLQNAATLQLYCGDGKWGGLPARAQCFASGNEALQWAWQQGFANVQLLYSFANSSHNFTVPITRTYQKDSNVLTTMRLTDAAHA